MFVPPGTAAFTVTRKRARVSSLGRTSPPALAVAPVPSRNVTVRVPPAYSAWSSPAASVFVPAFEPVITRLPGTYVTLPGRGSVRITFFAPSLPLFLTTSSYSSVSPGTVAPPFRSVTLLVRLSLMFGTKISVASVMMPG